MKIAVGLNRLWLAGAELNALDLACAMRDRGHEVVLFSQAEPDQTEADQPILAIARERGLQVALFPAGGVRDIIRPVQRLVAEEAVDLVHAYYPRLALGAFLGTHRRHGTPIVMTYYGMNWPRDTDPRFAGIPDYAHVVVGTEASATAMRAWYNAPISVIEPPVNVRRDHPGAVDSTALLREHALDDDHVRVVIVSRLEKAMKLEGVLRSVRALVRIGSATTDLIIVGSGDAEGQVRSAADAANAELGRRAVVVTGRLPDPRAAYEAADVVLGMGSSALRGMAFGKPVIVLGEASFVLPLEPRTVQYFLHNGYYGEGPLDDLPTALERFLNDPDLRAQCGELGLDLVRTRYSVDVAAGRLETIYQHALQQRISRRRWCVNLAMSHAYMAVPAFRAIEDARRLYMADRMSTHARDEGRWCALEDHAIGAER